MVTLVSETKLTLAKLADIAGVSTSTASRALKDNPLIKQETRSRIQALAKEHNFSINAAASRLRTQKTHVIAVILNLIDNTEQSTTDPFLLKLVGELNQALNAEGYELLLSNSFMASDDWANYFIRSQRADGHPHLPLQHALVHVLREESHDYTPKFAHGSGAHAVIP